MNRCSTGRCMLVLALALWLGFVSMTAQADSPAVRAVLFYSPNCGHCHKVMTEDLPPLFDEYGDQLQIIGVDVSNAEGSALYSAAAEKFGIPPEDQGVPLLIVADVVLIGSLDIPGQLPGLVEKYLAEGGVDWPDIPGMTEIVVSVQNPPTPTASPAGGTSAAGTPTGAAAEEGAAPAPTGTPAQVAAAPASSGAAGAIPGVKADDLRSRLARDPVGNALAVLVLVGMVAAVAGMIFLLRRPVAEREQSWQDWAMPVLALIGLGVALYLAFVETTQTRAVCGPVGDCNTVQESDYARLFGVLPIGVLGAAGYLAILATWAVATFSIGRLSRLATLALLALTTGGVLFSIYLTFLEPFVIGATCAWCLTSAVIMTSLMLLSADRVRQLGEPGSEPAGRRSGDRAYS